MPVMFDPAESGGRLDPLVSPPVRRGLILAGGGMKVAFQAGVLQVWLDEMLDPGTGEPVDFAFGDGASGGVFNLAMWCQGLTGQQIADRWRDYSPIRHGLSVNWRGLPRLESLLTMDRFRRRVFRELWALDWARIQHGRRGTFNVYAVRDQALRVVPSSAMTEDLLAAAGALPMWFPPVMSDGQRYIDAVFVTDANLDAAIKEGCNELWIIWTVSTSGRWRNGPIAQYFQMIEACANGRLRRTLADIAESNEAHCTGRHGRYPHPVRVVGLEAEVPLHYLLGLTRRGMRRAVDLGVERARSWCDEHGYLVRKSRPEAPSIPVAGARVRRKPMSFSERMSGSVAFGCSTPLIAAEIGDALGDVMTLRLDVAIDDLDRFRQSSDHLARVGGVVECQILGGRRPIDNGTLRLLPGTGPDPTCLEYRLAFRDRSRRPLELVGVKSVCDQRGFDVWRDTTTLDISVCRVDELSDGVTGQEAVVLAGRLHLTPWAFLRQLTTMRSTAPTLWQRLAAVATFAAFFLSRLARVYGGPARPLTPQQRAELNLNRNSGRAEFCAWPAEHLPAGAPVFAHNERVIPAPVGWVRDWIVHARLWPTFYLNSAWVRFGNKGEHVLKEGTTLRWITFGMPITSTVDLCTCSCTGPCRCEGPVRIGWSWKGLGCSGYHIWIIEPCRDGTRVVTEETQRGVLPRRLGAVLRWLLVRGHRYWLRQLARRAVTGPVEERASVPAVTQPLRKAL